MAAALLAADPQSVTPAQAVPVDKEPQHHLVLENEYTRVFSVQLPPHSQTLLHRHDRDYVYVTLGPAEIENDVLDKPPRQVKLQDGEANFVKGGFAHVAKNLADTPFRTVAIEVVGRAENDKPADKAERGLELGHGAISDLVADNDEVRIRDIQLAPGAMSHTDTPTLPHVLVAITDLNLHDEEKGGGTREIRIQAGGQLWMPAGATPMRTNRNKQPARYVTVEFK